VSFVVEKLISHRLSKFNLWAETIKLFLQDLHVLHGEDFIVGRG
jgi:hypothetical protein